MKIARVTSAEGERRNGWKRGRMWGRWLWCSKGGDWAAAGGASRFSFWVFSCWRQLLSCRLPVNVTPELTLPFTANFLQFLMQQLTFRWLGPDQRKSRCFVPPKHFLFGQIERFSSKILGSRNACVREPVIECVFVQAKMSDDCKSTMVDYVMDSHQLEDINLLRTSLHFEPNE